MWGLLADAGLPVVTHSGSGSGPEPGKHTGPAAVARLLARHPRLRLVVALMGMPEYAEFLAPAERYEEVRLDTTMASPTSAGGGERVAAGGLYGNEARLFGGLLRARLSQGIHRFAQECSQGRGPGCVA